MSTDTGIAELFVAVRWRPKHYKSGIQKSLRCIFETSRHSTKSTDCNKSLYTISTQMTMQCESFASQRT